MKITPCPKCGRTPTIRECIQIKKYKNGTRRRLCGCNNYCSVIPCKDHLNRSWFEFDGEGDDNAIFREWNKAVEIYLENESLDFPEKWTEWKWFMEDK